jgi:hypothetical protein
MCDDKASWVEKCGDIQAKLFEYAFALAMQTG